MANATTSENGLIAQPGTTQESGVIASPPANEVATAPQKTAVKKEDMPLSMAQLAQEGIPTQATSPSGTQEGQSDAAPTTQESDSSTSSTEISLDALGQAQPQDQQAEQTPPPVQNEGDKAPEAEFDAQKQWDKLKAQGQAFLDTFQLPDSILEQLSPDDIQRLSDAAAKLSVNETFPNNKFAHTLAREILKRAVGRGTQSTANIEDLLRTVELAALAGIDAAIPAKSVLGFADDTSLTPQDVTTRNAKFAQQMNGYSIQQGIDKEGIFARALLVYATDALKMGLQDRISPKERATITATRAQEAAQRAARAQEAANAAAASGNADLAAKTAQTAARLAEQAKLASQAAQRAAAEAGMQQIAQDDQAA